MARDATTKATFHQILHIGAGCDHEVEMSGYLHAHANDNWGSYAKNKGFMELTIEKNRRLRAAIVFFLDNALASL